METCTVALFGEAEKGNFEIGYFCHTLPELADSLGNPPPESRGLYYAVQVLLFQWNLLFFRVKEEGFSYEDYLQGLKILEKSGYASRISAICLPGVGNSQILEATAPLCHQHHSILITNESDLYDYLTQQ